MSCATVSIHSVLNPGTAGRDFCRETGSIPQNRCVLQVVIGFHRIPTLSVVVFVSGEHPVLLASVTPTETYRGLFCVSRGRVSLRCRNLDRRAASHKDRPETWVDEFIFKDAPDLFEDKLLHLPHVFQHLLAVVLVANLTLNLDLLE